MSVKGIDFAGNGADFVVEIADGRVVGVESQKPAATIIGEQQVSVIPMEAIENFMNGSSGRSVFIPEEGVCVIESVKFAYLVHRSSEPQSSLHCSTRFEED